MPPHWVALEVEINVHILSETTAVVIAVRFCIAECLENAVGLEQYVLDSAMGRRASLMEIMASPTQGQLQPVGYLETC